MQVRHKVPGEGLTAERWCDKFACALQRGLQLVIKDGRLTAAALLLARQETDLGRAHGFSKSEFLTRKS